MTDIQQIPAPVQRLLDRGVIIHNPLSVEIGEQIDPERIAPGVVLHAGSRLRGNQTSIGPNCILGHEAPVTVHDCCLGQGVQLAGGFFEKSTFLDGASMGLSKRSNRN